MLSLHNQIRAFVGLAILLGMALQVFAAKDGDVFRGTITFQRSGDLYFFMETDAGAVWRVQRARNVPPVKRGDVVDVRGKKIGGIATPRMSAEMVRQDWSRFKLDFAFPMDYASFYGEGCAWILSCVSEARKAIDGDFPIFPGLYLHDFTPTELEAALPRILDANPEGFCLFAHDGLTPERLAALRRVVLKAKAKEPNRPPCAKARRLMP